MGKTLNRLVPTRPRRKWSARGKTLVHQGTKGIVLAESSFASTEATYLVRLEDGRMVRIPANLEGSQEDV